MSKKLLYLFLPAFFFTSDLFSQDTAREFVILNSGDTVFLKIIKKYKYTNKDKLTFKNSISKYKTLTAGALKKYFDGEFFYISEKESNTNTFVLINYYADGFCKIGISYDDRGKELFFLNNSETIIPLDEYKYNLHDVFKKYLIRYDDFSKQYSEKIYYNYKSLGNFISAYNEFINPEIYKKSEYKNRQSFNYLLSIMPYNFGKSFRSSDIILNGFRIFDIKLSAKNKFSRSFSLLTSAAFGLNNYISDWMAFNYLSYSLEEEAEILAYESPKFDIFFRIGGTVSYNYKLSENINPFSSVFKKYYISPYSSKINLDFVIDLKNHFRFFIGYNIFNISITEQQVMSKLVFLKSKVQGLNLGISFKYRKY